MGKSNQKIPATLCEEEYQRFWGSRWPALKQALLEDRGKILRPNRWAQTSLKEMTPFLPQVLPQEAHETSPNGFRKFYVMDEASALVAHLLPIPPKGMVLDACAAPGGKALVLLEKAQAQKATLVLNDLSRARRARLKKVLTEYVPSHIIKEIKVTPYDASRIGHHQKERYDAILLDAPCSSEAHLLKKPALWARHSIKKSKFLAKRQYALLRSLCLALKPGGKLLYATCALLPIENDEVVQKTLQKNINIRRFSFTPPALAEKTSWGYQFLPDTSGKGPLYFCILEKIK